MKSVRHIIELETRDGMAEVFFVRDVNGVWHADVKLGDGSSWSFRQQDHGPFHACELHAERLYFVALDRVNSGRAA